MCLSSIARHGGGVGGVGVGGTNELGAGTAPASVGRDGVGSDAQEEGGGRHETARARRSQVRWAGEGDGGVAHLSQSSHFLFQVGPELECCMRGVQASR